MKKVVIWVVVVAAVAAVAALWSTGTRSQSPPTGKFVDVVMMSCNPDSSFSVAGFKGSASTPSRRSGGCPDNLSQLAKDGFRVVDTGYFDHDTNLIVFTLVR